jgi:XRE family transcriptional regulator, regulator of sulfur utilization
MSALVRQFGLSVRHWRESRAWTQEQLAARAGLNRTFVGEIERGACIASILTAEKLAQALDVPLALLLTPEQQHGYESLANDSGEPAP